MSDKVTLYELPPSPNNMKVRIALNYKKIPFEAVVVGFEDREAVVKASGQPLTPALTHGDRAIFDSSAILRYLDANFDGPKLFGTERPAIREIEEWEQWQHTDGKRPTVMIVSELLGFSDPKPDTGAKASARLNDITARIEERLGESDWLVGDAMTAADVLNAPWMAYGILPAERAAEGPMMKHFHENLKLGEGREKTRAWIGRVMSHCT